MKTFLCAFVSVFCALAGLSAELPGQTLWKSNSLYYIKGASYTYLGGVFWDDLVSPAFTFKTGSGAPTYDTNECAYAFQSGDSCFPTPMQLPHSYMEGTDLHPHIHFHKTAHQGTGGSNIVWQLDYKWANVEGQFPAAWTTIVWTNSVDQPPEGTSTYITNVLTHHLAEPSTSMSGSGKTVSGYIKTHLLMTTNTANPYQAGSVYVDGFDLHFQKDSPGSRFELTK